MALLQKMALIQEQNFQISLFTKYLPTYIHSFIHSLKLESNDKAPDFFLQNFLQIFPNLA